MTRSGTRRKKKEKGRKSEQVNLTYRLKKSHNSFRFAEKQDARKQIKELDPKMRRNP